MAALNLLGGNLTNRQLLANQVVEHRVGEVLLLQQASLIESLLDQFALDLQRQRRIFDQQIDDDVGIERGLRIGSEIRLLLQHLILLHRSIFFAGFLIWIDRLSKNRNRQAGDTERKRDEGG